MRITLIRVEDFQRLKTVEIEPNGRSMILIGGKNEQGKSTLLRAIRTAFGGASEKPDKPIREGSEVAQITIELDGGDLAIVKEFKSDGKAYLEVRSGKLGKLTSPQKVLDGIVGKCFLDPLDFVRMSDKAQRAKLLSIIDVGIDLDENEVRRAAAFSERTDRNRAAKQVRAELAGIDDPGEISDKVDIQALIDELDVFAKSAVVAEEASNDMRALERRVNEARDSVEHSTVRFDAARQQMREHRESLDLVTAEYKARFPGLEDLATVDNSERASEVRDELAKADDHNSEVEQAKAAAAQSVRLKSSAEQIESEANALTDRLSALAKERTDALSAAKMPVPGLDVSENGVLLNGNPLSQAGKAQQMILSLSIASAANPELRDICIEDASLLDDDSLKIVADFAAKNDLQVWLERVGTSDDNCIVIEDGEVAA